MNRVSRWRCTFRRFKRRNIFVVTVTNDRLATNAIPLHHLQIPGGMGLMVSSSNPSMDRPSGRMELASKRRNRSLSISDHSWTASRRKTTTTPAKPASATAICAATPSASPGSMVLLVVAGSTNKSLFLRTHRLALLFWPPTYERIKHHGYLCLSHSVPRSGDSEYQRHCQTRRRCNG